MLMSAFWELLRSGNMGLDKFKFLTKLTDEDAIIVYNWYQDDYSMDEIKKLLKNDDNK